MSNDPQADLIYAILAMDSYNRGYGSGITVTEITVTGNYGDSLLNAPNRACSADVSNSSPRLQEFSFLHEPNWLANADDFGPSSPTNSRQPFSGLGR